MKGIALLIIGFLLALWNAGCTPQWQKCDDYDKYGHMTHDKLQMDIDQAHACKNGWANCDPKLLGCQTIELLDILMQKWNCE